METNVTIATIAKKVSEKNKPSAKRFIITCVVLILSVILLAVSVSMMLDTAWANDGEILTENVATTETMAEPAPAFDDEPIESVEESEPEAPVQAIEPVEEAANYIGTDEIRCYMVSSSIQSSANWFIASAKSSMWMRRLCSVSAITNLVSNLMPKTLIPTARRIGVWRSATIRPLRSSMDESTSTAWKSCWMLKPASGPVVRCSNITRN